MEVLASQARAAHSDYGVSFATILLLHTDIKSAKMVRYVIITIAISNGDRKRNNLWSGMQ
jgi:hypothetical protein